LLEQHVSHNNPSRIDDLSSTSFPEDGKSATQKSSKIRPNSIILTRLSNMYPGMSQELKSADSYASVARIVRSYWTGVYDGTLTSPYHNRCDANIAKYAAPSMFAR
jgi:hypothetical protein